MIETIVTKRGRRRKRRKGKYISELSPASIRYQVFSRFVTGLSLFPSRIHYNLTISDEKKFVWFRVPKVATRTILFLLTEANVQLTAEHPVKCHYPINRYDDYFKFAFVRNPWDRLVSCWHDKVVEHHRLGLNEEQISQMQDFENFVDYVAGNIDLESGNHHLRLQCKLIDLNHVDYLGHFENFREDLEDIKTILGIDAVTRKKNSSKRKKEYRYYYNNRTKEKVAELYRRDIQIFNYEF